MQESQQREAQLRQQLEQVIAGQQQQQEQAQAQAQEAQAVFQTNVGTAFQELAQRQQDLSQVLREKPEKKITLWTQRFWQNPRSSQEMKWVGCTGRPGSSRLSLEITAPAIRAAFQNVNPPHQEVRDVEDINVQLYAILQTLCEKEPFQVVRSAGKSHGLEAWSKLNRRLDPSTGGRRGAMLKTILSPTKCTKLDGLWSAVETWEEAVRQSENRKRSDGSRHVLDDEIKISILEQMCPRPSGTCSSTSRGTRATTMSVQSWCCTSRQGWDSA